MMAFNSSLTSGFCGYCFWCGNRLGSLSLIMTGTAFCAQPTVFPLAHTLGFTLCWINGRKREVSIFMKIEAWTLLSIIPPQKGWESLRTIRNSWENSPESQLQLKGWLKNSIWLWLSHYSSGSGGKWTRGFSEHRERCLSVQKKIDWLADHSYWYPGFLTCYWVGSLCGDPWAPSVPDWLSWEPDPWGLHLWGQSLLQCGPLQTGQRAGGSSDAWEQLSLRCPSSP